MSQLTAHYLTYVFCNRSRTIDEMLYRMFDRLWDQNRRPAVLVNARTVAILKGQNPVAPGQDQIIFNLSSEATTNVDFVRDEKFRITHLRFTARFNQIATTVMVPIDGIYSVFDYDDREMQLDLTTFPYVKAATRFGLLSDSDFSDVAMIEGIVTDGVMQARVTVSPDAHGDNAVPSLEELIAQCSDVFAETQFNRQLTGGILTAPMIGEPQPEVPGTVAPFSMPNHTGMPPVTNPTTTTCDAAEDKPNFAEAREDCKVIDFAAARARRGQ